MSGIMQLDRAGLVGMIRAVCAREFKMPADHPFFSANYLEGETPDAALVRLFREEQETDPSADPESIVMVLCHG